MLNDSARYILDTEGAAVYDQETGARYPVTAGPYEVGAQVIYYSENATWSRKRDSC